MKKYIIIAVLLTLAQYVNAQTIWVDGIYYSINPSIKCAIATRNPNRNYAAKIVIPENIKYKEKTYRVISIDEEAFYCENGIVSIIIPNSVTRIGERAFKWCENLSSINISTSVTTIAEESFNGCKKLVSITIPHGVNSIDDKAFLGCISLSSIKIPSSIQYIGEDAFYCCKKLLHISFPDNITYIGASAFRGCTSLTSIQLPSNLNKINNNVFRDCSSLSTVVIGEKVESIGMFAFAGCKSLTSIIIPSGVTSIGDYAFDDCPNLKEVHISSQMLATAKKLFPSNVKIYTDVKDGPVLLATKEKVKVTEIPNLEFVANSLTFIDQNGENTINGGQNSKIQFKVQNTGKGSARTCKAKVTSKGTTQGIKVSDISIDMIKPGETKAFEIPIIAGMNTQDGEVELAVQVDEPNGFGTDPQYITIKTRAFEEPLVQITDYSLTGVAGNTLKKKLPFDLQLMLQNTKYGKAEDVIVSVDIPQNVLLVEGEKEQKYNSLNSGETKSLVYSLIVNNNYSGSEIPINIHLKEKYGKYAENRTITLRLDQALASQKITIEEKARERENVQIARLGSDVDKNIPISSLKQDKTFAVVISNEHYQMVEGVPYASNDGAMFKAYLQQTLGIPESNIRMVTDATLNSLKFQVDWLKKVVEAHNGEARAIFYYAGHGVPDERDNTAYLLPVDGYVSDTSTGYSLDKLYQTFGELPAQSVTLFLDACFSGAKRDGSMLASARGVAIKAKKSTPQGKLIVLSAAQGDETAYPYNEQQHGLFTYYLLKKLQESQGNVSMGELSEYVIQEVKRQSLISNNKMQTPSINVASSLQDSWRSMKLK